MGVQRDETHSKRHTASRCGMCYMPDAMQANPATPTIPAGQTGPLYPWLVFPAWLAGFLTGASF